jgi:putative radical SAM enzyme (TIGR03279 family)
MPRRHRYTPEAFPVKVEPASPAEEAGIQTGDIILSINGEEVGDYLQFYDQIADEYLELEFLRPGAEESYETVIVRDYGRSLGLIPNPSPMKDVVECENKCVFCFIHQQPKGLRRTIFIRDDDYRYSFSHGNFITLTNLTQGDWQRVYRDRLSPLNISVHSMSPSVRTRLIKHKRAGRIREQLTSLVNHDISFHTQIVLCPDYNDRKDLDRTLEKLMAFVPHLLSVSIVPIGLTRFRDHLPDMDTMYTELAEDTIARVHRWQKVYIEKFGTPIVRLADEFYWMTGHPYPEYAHYEDFEQLEDGVGSVRKFLDTYQNFAHKLPAKLKRPTRVTIMTGQIAADVLTPIAQDACRRVANLEMDIHRTLSDFWGPTITVTGLLTGKDLVAKAQQIDLGDEVWVPGVMVRNDEQRFLDDMTVTELSQTLGRPVRVVNERAEGFIKAIRDLNATRRQDLLALKAVV